MIHYFAGAINVTCETEIAYIIVAQADNRSFFSVSRRSCSNLAYRRGYQASRLLLASSFKVV